MFKEIERQMKEALGPEVSRNIEFFDLKPEFIKRDPRLRSGGFRVKITRNGDGPPSIDIKAFGDMDEDMAKKMTEALKAQTGGKAQEPSKTIEVQEDEIPARKRPRAVSGYSEPAATTKWVGDHLVVEMALPEVESEEDIEVSKIGESIEIRAFAGDKGYFKILSIPKEAKLLSKTFKGSTLKIKIG